MDAPGTSATWFARRTSRSLAQRVRARCGGLAQTSRLALLLCSLLVLWRALPRLTSAHLWAEDGAVFLPQALELGARAVFLPHAGYFQLLPRLVAGGWSLLPLQYFAYG